MDHLKLDRVGILSRAPDARRKPVLSQANIQKALHRVRCRLEQAKISTYLLDNDFCPKKLDLVIVLGGDGSVLKALSLSPYCPILAINYGGVGFLTAAESNDLDTALERLLRGDYVISKRLLLECCHPAGKSLVVNEVSLRSSWRMLDLEVFVDGARIRSIRGDGVIVGTPTGSTAYLLSCGSPIVMPTAQCLVLCGMNEYNFSSRPLVLPDSSTVKLSLRSLLDKQTTTLYVDGVPKTTINEGQAITISASSKPATLVFFDSDFFFRNLSSRLSWH